MDKEIKKIITLIKIINENPNSKVSKLILRRGEERSIEENIKIIKKTAGGPLSDEELKLYKNVFSDNEGVIEALEGN